jgi:FkbM family methyltransferase
LSPISRFVAWIVGLYIHRTREFRGKRQSLFVITKLFKHLPVQSAYDVRMVLDAFDRTNWYGISGKYGSVVSREISKLREGDCFIDVGANCGVFSLMAAKQIGPQGVVIAFEPNLRTFAQLIENIRLNQAQNVIPFNLALSDRTDFIQLESGDPQHSGRCAIQSASSPPGGAAVGGINIADFAALGLLIGHRRTLVKIDVEGYEHRVLVGLKPILERPSTVGVIVEIDQGNLDRFEDLADDIYDYLEHCGFRATGNRRSDRHFDEVFLRPEPAVHMSQHAKFYQSQSAS